jgi:hypothetical protein
MALVREVDSLDDVPEYARPGYKQVGEKWVNEDIEDVKGLKQTAATRRAEREAVAAELKPFKELGMTAAEILALKEEIAAKRDDGGSEKDVEKLIAKRVKEVEDRFKPDLDERDVLRAENRKLLLTDEIRAAFIAAGGLEEDADDVVRLNADRFDLGEKNDKTGKRRIIVKDDDGDPTGMSPKDWFEKEHRPKKLKNYKGTGASGGGSTGGSGGSGDADLAQLTPAQRLTEIRRRTGK